jgi:hypothetical protein
MTDNHQKFLAGLKESKEWVWKTAELLNDCGYPVTVNPTTYAETHEDWKQHADNGDLTINQTIEVKHRTLNFTCRDDYPYATVLICAVHSHKNKKPRPWGYVIWNRDGTHIAVIKTDTEKSWTIKRVTDRRFENYSQDQYQCPLEVVTFHEANNDR